MLIKLVVEVLQIELESKGWKARYHFVLQRKTMREGRDQMTSPVAEKRKIK